MPVGTLWVLEMIGRRRELAAVERLLRQGAAGVGGHLVVTGPPGAGKSAFTQASAALARTRGIPVHWVAGPTSGEELLDLAGPPPGDARPDLDRDARGPRLVVVDDLDRAGTDAVESLAFLVPRLGAGPAMVVATAAEPLGMGPELRLGGLAESDLAALVPELPADAVHALWLVSGGLPGPALGFAGELIGGDTSGRDNSGRDAVVRLALTAPSRSGFLELDTGLIRLLEEAASRSLPAEVRARVLARLARQLLGDPSAEARRRALVEEAVASHGRTARPARSPRSSTPACTRCGIRPPRASASPSPRRSWSWRGGPATRHERRGLFWRFTALAELADLEAAEAALTAYARAGELAGDAEAAVVVRSPGDAGDRTRQVRPRGDAHSRGRRTRPADRAGRYRTPGGARCGRHRRTARRPTCAVRRPHADAGPAQARSLLRGDGRPVAGRVRPRGRGRTRTGAAPAGRARRIRAALDRRRGRPGDRGVPGGRARGGRGPVRRPAAVRGTPGRLGRSQHDHRAGRRLPGPAGHPPRPGRRGRTPPGRRRRAGGADRRPALARTDHWPPARGPDPTRPATSHVPVRSPGVWAWTGSRSGHRTASGG